MTKHRTVEIDFEIYQLIMLEKRDFEEPNAIALRRLLGLPLPMMDILNLALTMACLGPAKA